MKITKITDWNNIISDLILRVKPNFYLLLTGDLGAGKTTFTKLLLKQLGVQDVVVSPTFQILKQYKISNNLNINHMDAYRLSESDDIEMYLEQFENSFNIIEWPSHLALDYSNLQGYHLDIKLISEEIREVLINTNLSQIKGE
ncbi:hypothetical protein SSABA_v1c01310 [Spiroplasma sabaudiense Ar-1343]|uniref:tRNA threonylcarbamoyladenosine biosynthesis protein TsaE n=1 Tax=Spiroplasma sabaudiense Ar-1343 TaxID=1276257 RepID=W6A8Q5_9MOLU|nr:tRNA (adenosine(37)-N6)-threonylcarbamoyltransferase complex ATPase subunit type 1 TsaE [Spiroplasma sabaudiense]AHI53543.1 hypothetical protein SSABA_v1c01310 [Spiroplasma sabaudiense Ar-1343]